MQKGKENIKIAFKKRMYSFVLRLIEFIDALPKDNVSRRISDQLLRSGTSILGNYVEAQSAASKKEFVNYFNISLRSTNESKMWLALLRDSKRTKSESVQWFLCELDEFSKIFASSILTAKGKRTI
ncbi:MAG: four helix bundle protein [Sedimentisphaerales bacterium]